MGTLRVISPGVLTTVQDLGRAGFGAMGVPTGGAADTLSLRVGNRLVGNADSAAGIEMTILGGTYEFLDDALVAFTGGETRVDAEDSSGEMRSVPICTRVSVKRGERVRVGAIVRGVRTYLCIAGGVDVPRVMSSASTLLSARFGGLEGRTLRSGDELAWVERGFGESQSRLKSPTPNPSRWEGLFDARIREVDARALNERLLRGDVIRAIDGAHVEEFDSDSRNAFWNNPFRVSSRSDRVGVRLEGFLGNAKSSGRMASIGMMCGAVQVPPGGEAIVLMADHPTTGGYPVIACVASVDLPRLGQLRPGETIRFSRVTREAALHDFNALEAELDNTQRNASESVA